MGAFPIGNFTGWLLLALGGWVGWRRVYWGWGGLENRVWVGITLFRVFVFFSDHVAGRPLRVFWSGANWRRGFGRVG